MNTTIKLAFSMLFISSIFTTGCGSDTSNETDGEVVKDKSIVGAWDFNDGTEFGMLIFYANGFYIHWQDGQIDPNCGTPAGVEYGTYTFDGTVLDASPVVDANSCGLGDAPLNITVTATQLNFPDGYTSIRIDGGADSIVGAWGDDAGVSDPFGLVFNNSGRYIHWQDTQSDPNCAPGGVEYGTYSLVGSDLSHTTTTDNSGQCGVNDVRFPDAVINNVTVSGDALSFAGDPLNRVKSPNL